MSSDGIVEVPGIILLIVCLLRSSQYVMKSHVKQIKAFWLAAVLIFVSVIRRELNYLPDLLVPSDFLMLGQSYDWWEDSVLTVIYLIALGLPHTFGEIVEELAETAIYGIALTYLWQFKLANYESCLVQKLNYKFDHANN